MSSEPSQSMDQPHLLQNQFYLNPNTGYQQHHLQSNSYENYEYDPQYTQRAPFNNIIGPSGPMNVPLNDNILGYSHEMDEYCKNTPRINTTPAYHQDARSANCEFSVNAEDRIIDISKRYRTVFTDNQKETLRKEFAVNMFLNQQRRKNIAAMLHLSEKTVKVWFQNRRMDIQRQKKQKGLNSFDDVKDPYISPASSTLPCEGGLYCTSPGFQMPHNYNQAMTDYPCSSSSYDSPHPVSAYSSSAAYSNGPALNYSG